MPQTVRRLSLDTLAALLLLLFCALLLLSLKNPTSMDDGLRHFAMAKQLRDVGIGQVPGWSQFFYEGYLHTHPVDPWFLSDVLLIPFTYFPIAKGLQLFVVCEVAALFAAFLLILRSFRLSARDSTVFLLLLVFGDTQFMGRFLLGRPYALMTAMALFVLYAIFERRWMLLTVLMLISVLLSQLFTFGLFICLCGIFAYAFTGHTRDALKAGTATVTGVLLGFLLHPQPLLYLEYLYAVFLKIPFLHFIGLSREMQSGIVDGASLSVLVALMMITLFNLRFYANDSLPNLKKEPHVLLLSLCTLAFTAAFAFWVRAIDMLWPLLVLTVARFYMMDRSAPRDLLKILLPRKMKVMAFLKWFAIGVCIAEVLLLPYVFTRDDSKHSFAPYAVLDSLPAHAKVLNLDWDAFFAYVARRPDLQYAAGIDRAFTYLTDPDISQSIYLLEQSAGGKDTPDIQKTLNTILAAYPSDYLVVSHKKFPSVIQYLLNHPAYRLISDNGTIAVYAVPDWYRPDYR